MTTIERPVARLRPLAEFLTSHGIVFNEDKMKWELYGRYCYQSLRALLQNEGLGPLMNVTYQIPWSSVIELEAHSPIFFHKLDLVKR